ncbi:GIY-YIG nuclease family protein [Candidatus Daviesbacteria bacterium]|nr:GIY-YIG nuclease family protein [Candidatus Daviesbacteria bacterium]
MSFYYTYVLKSIKDGKLYVGATSVIKQRLKDHNDGLVESTKSRRPLELVYFEGCTDKHKAFRREQYFKTGFGRRFLKDRI